MSASPHRIRRQRWTVKAGSAAEAFTLRQHLRAHWSEELLPAMQRAFDEAAAGRTVHLPKLELTFRFPTPDHLTAELPARLCQQLREQLQSGLHSVPPAPDHETPAADLSADPFQSLLHYLQTGRLPWPAIRESSPDATCALQEACQRERVRLLEHLRTQSEPDDFHFRLLQLLPESEAPTFAAAAVNRLASELQAGVTAALAILLASAPTLLGRYSQLRLLAAMLGSGDAAPRTARTPPLASVAASVLTATERPAFEHILRSLPDSAARLFRPAAKAAAAGETSFAQAAVAAPGQPAKPELSWPSSWEQAGAELSHGQAPVETALQAASRHGMDEDDFGTLVHYAGLVLLHPFLPRFFEAIHLDGFSGVSGAIHPLGRPLTPADEGAHPLSDGGTGDPPVPLGDPPDGTGVTLPPPARSAQDSPPLRQTARAAAALHFLATGQEELFEHELAFIQVLLGRHPDQPLLVAEGLLEAETKAEAEALLRSVITYWTALKHTSIAGLRESFLNRPGLLRETAAGWKLQSERRPYDVLLDQLPWTIGIAKLPWMPLPLFTQW